MTFKITDYMSIHELYYTYGINTVWIENDSQYQTKNVNHYYNIIIILL